MRQLIKLLLAISIIYVTAVPAHTAVEGLLEYHIPLDYTKLSQEELDTKAGFYYNLATKNYSGKLNGVAFYYFFKLRIALRYGLMTLCAYIGGVPVFIPQLKG